VCDTGMLLVLAPSLSPTVSATSSDLKQYRR